MPVQMASTSAVMPGQASAAMPTTRETRAKSNHPATGPARSPANARAPSPKAVVKAHTAKRMTNAPTVIPGHATDTMPMTMARTPRQSKDVDRDTSRSSRMAQ
jgi:hypothetical protein